MAEQQGKTVKDVPAEAFVVAFSHFLKKSGKAELPDWVHIVKTGRHKELAPYDEDWYYTRMASTARHLRIRAPAGVGAFTKVYGGRKRNGTAPSHFCRSSSGVTRKVLQSLEKMGLVEKDAAGGRRLTPQGMKDLDTIASQVATKQHA